MPEPETCARTFSQNPFVKPENQDPVRAGKVPRIIIRILAFLGLLKGSHEQAQYCYLAYDVMIWVVRVFGMCFQLQFIISKHRLGKLSLEYAVHKLILVTFHMLVALPLWVTWKRQLSCTGTVLGLFHYAAKMGHAWSKLIASLKKAVFLLILLCGGTFTWYVSQWKDDELTIHISESSTHIVIVLYTGLYWGGVISQFLCFSWFVGHVWLVSVASGLHIFQFQCYSQAITRALSTDASPHDIAVAVERIEKRIGRHLRDASHTWVRVVLFCAGTLFACFGVSSLFLARSEKLQAIRVSGLALVSAFTGFCGCLLALPLANVSTHFHEDVVRYLNTPTRLKCAQRVFGQQFIAHVGNLD